MVGIVIVSHSAKLAEGVVQLASQMSGPEVKLRAAGGVDFDADTLGTDPMKILLAIEAVYSKDGVLVLMDLGSAVLNSEMALDFLALDQRKNVVMCEAPIVEGAVAAAVQARLGSSLEQVAAEARNSLGVKIANLGESAGIPADPKNQSGESKSFLQSLRLESAQLRLTVHNPLGLHARPVARFVQTVSRFPETDVQVTNVTTNRGPANARSINALATLGVRQGHEILITLSGAQSQAALNEIQRLADDNFGDHELTHPMRANVVPTPSQIEIRNGSPLIIGTPVSAGIAVAPAQLLRKSLPPVVMRTVSNPEAEWQRFKDALTKTRQQILQSRDYALRNANPYTAEIFDAHILFLEDEALIGPTRSAIMERWINAEAAWQAVVREMTSQYRGLEDDYLSARVIDIEDVARQVLINLMGVDTQPIMPTEAGILVTEELSPSETARLNPKMVKGIATAAGGATSHSVILARSLGIPAVAGLGRSILGIDEGTKLILDGSTGQLWINPDEELITSYRNRAERETSEKKLMLTASLKPALTLDSHRIEVAANIGGTADARAANKVGAEAAGLFHTEFLFLDRQIAPNEEEQFLVYNATAEALGGRPLVIRTLDAGGDKPIPYLDIGHEENPYLGYRAIRLCLDRPDLFKIQLNAIVRVAATHPLKVMFPMIATINEWRRARALLAESINDVRSRGLPVPKRIETGIMVEVPSTAVLADQFATEVDFFSIGTNDLTQYTLAAERGNPRVANLSDALHPSILRLINMVVEAAHKRGKWVGVCGEAGGDPVAVPILVGLGVDELSMGASAIPRAKQIIRQLTYANLKQKVLPLLALESADAVRKAAGEMFNLSIS